MDTGMFEFWMSAKLAKILDDGKPHHLAISFGLKKGIRLYIDNKLQDNNNFVDNIKLWDEHYTR